MQIDRIVKEKKRKTLLATTICWYIKKKKNTYLKMTKQRRMVDMI